MHHTDCVSPHEIHHLLNLYGLPLVVVAVGVQALGPPIPGGTALVAAAVYASSRHGFPLAGVLAAGAVGAFGGTTAGYLLGRWRGEAVLHRLARVARRRPERVQRLRESFVEHAALTIVIGRFITGVRNVVGLVAGASGLPAPRFLALSALAAVLWSAVVTLENYFLGHAFLAASTWLQVLIVAVGIGATAVSLGLLRQGSRVAAGEGRAEASPPPAAD